MFDLFIFVDGTRKRTAGKENKDVVRNPETAASRNIGNYLFEYNMDLNSNFLFRMIAIFVLKSRDIDTIFCVG